MLIPNMQIIFHINTNKLSSARISFWIIRFNLIKFGNRFLAFDRKMFQTLASIMIAKVQLIYVLKVLIGAMEGGVCS